MNLIPSQFDINGNVVVRFDMESLIQLALTLIIVIIVGLMAQRFIKSV